VLPERVERQHDVLATLGNEYATIWLSVDREGNDPRLRVASMRDHTERLFDATALSLLCHADEVVMGVIADIARDGAARQELAAWAQSRRARQGGAGDDGAGG
jgi:hypothetical protein